MTRPADLAPAGLRDADLGSRRQDAVSRHVQRLAPSTRTTPRTSTAAPDLAIIATDTGWSDTAQSDRLLRAGVPHLLSSVRENTGVVGPFVLPGRTSCHRCHELHRTAAVVEGLCDGGGCGDSGVATVGLDDDVVADPGFPLEERQEMVVEPRRLGRGGRGHGDGGLRQRVSLGARDGSAWA